MRLCARVPVLVWVVAALAIAVAGGRCVGIQEGERRAATGALADSVAHYRAQAAAAETDARRARAELARADLHQRRDSIELATLRRRVRVTAPGRVVVTRPDPATARPIEVEIPAPVELTELVVSQERRIAGLEAAYLQAKIAAETERIRADAERALADAAERLAAAERKGWLRRTWETIDAPVAFVAGVVLVLAAP